jgi:hypothetical protein
MHHQTHEEQYQEQKEQDLGNPRECDSDPAESHNRRHKCDQKENQRVIKHLRIPPSLWTNASHLPSCESSAINEMRRAIPLRTT